MGNTLKMEKQALIKQLIAAGWSDRKIHGSTGLNRRTLSSYRKKFKKELEAERVNASQENGCESTSSSDVNGRLKVYQFRSSKVYHFHRLFSCFSGKFI